MAVHHLESEGILKAVGCTPLVPLERMFPGERLKVYAKLEFLNPGGSIKDRSALFMIQAAIDKGDINQETVIIESSSGNLAIGLAQICNYYKLRLICIVDSRTTRQNLKLLQIYGAEVEVVDQPHPTTGELLTARLERVKELCQIYPNSYWTNQYSNVHNALAHYHTMGEIIKALPRPLDYLFVAISSCGTLRGCAEYVRDRQLKTQIIAVDAVGSLITSTKSAERIVPGFGAGLRPDNYVPELISRSLQIPAHECILGCRQLIQQESIMAGGSSGGVIAAIEHLKHQIESNVCCVAILPDRGERYLDTVYSDTWVEKQFGTQLLNSQEIT